MKKISLLFALLFVLIGCSFFGNDNVTPQKEVVEINRGTSNIYSDLTDLIEDVKNTVVDIYTSSINAAGAGSGVIVGKADDGYYIITNHHVIDGASHFEVVVYLDEFATITYQASLIGTSVKNDIAVLKIEAKETLKVANIIDDSTKVKIGTEVVAIGNPLGVLGGSVSHGIISAIEREVYLSELGYMSLFQTDAAINSGNSGGALFNYEGLLIGIVNSGYTNYEGLNFAIPANVAVESFTSIVETVTDTTLGYVKGEADLGLSLAESNIYGNSNLNSQVEIVYVSQVQANSDAEKAGILDYTSFANNKIDTFYALSKINGVEVSSLSEAIKILDDVQSGVEISFEFVEIAYTRAQGFFGQTALYLSDTVVTINVTPTQYVYTIS